MLENVPTQEYLQNSIKYLPLTFSQKWLLNELEKYKYPGWCTIEFLTKTKVPIDQKAMETAVLFLVNKYENLRVKINRTNGEWIQELYPPSETQTFNAYDFSHETPKWQSERVREVCINERDWLLPKYGKLFKVVFFKFSENEGRIWFCIHHVISDFMSVVMLAGELLDVYHSIVAGKNLDWRTSTSYRKWLYLVEGYSRDVLMPSEMKYWTSLPWKKAKILPSDYPSKFNSEDDIRDIFLNRKVVDFYRTIELKVSCEETLQLISNYGRTLEKVLIATFFLAIAKNMQLDWLDLQVCCSGRNILPNDYQVDISKLCGYLALSRAMLLKKPDSGLTFWDIQNVIEQIENIPNEGVGYPLISNCIHDNELKASFSSFRKYPDIFFNYIGRVDAIKNDEFEMVEEDTGLNLHAPEIKTISLECVVTINSNQLLLRFLYNEQYSKVSTIERLGHAMRAMLEEMAVERKVEAIK